MAYTNEFSTNPACSRRTFVKGAAAVAAGTAVAGTYGFDYCTR